MSVKTFPMPDTGAMGGGEYIDAAGNAVGGGWLSNMSPEGKQFLLSQLSGNMGQGQQSDPTIRVPQQTLGGGSNLPMLQQNPQQQAMAPNNLMQLLLTQGR